MKKTVSGLICFLCAWATFFMLPSCKEKLLVSEQGVPLEYREETIGGEITEQSDVLVSYSASYPVFAAFASPSSGDIVNDFYSEQAEGFISWAKSFEEEVRNAYRILKEDEILMPYDFSSKFSVKYNKNGLLSVVTQERSYTGGAHDNITQIASNWDISKGKQIDFDALFTAADDAKSYITEQILMMAANNVTSGMGYYEDYQNVINKSAADKFYFDENGLVFYFDVYEIAPYAAGIQEFPIPYSAVSHLLKEEYAKLSS